jgi:hypothetical protein
MILAIKKSIKSIKDYLFSLRFNSKLYSEITRKKHVICFGDSHVTVFKYIQDNNLLKDYLLDVVDVGGATAQGLVNPNSKTDALEIFRRRLRQAKRFQTILLQLGEVDCGFVIWYYAEKYSVSVKEQLKRSIDNYVKFVRELQDMGFKSIIAVSAPLPTICDGQDWGEVANARREVKASQKERTDLTLTYNQLLKKRCKGLGIVFLDTTGQLYDEDTGLIKSCFLNEDRVDHHLNNKRYADIICGFIGGSNRPDATTERR